MQMPKVIDKIGSKRYIKIMHFSAPLKFRLGCFNKKKQPSGSPYHTILPVDSHSTGGQSWNFIAQWKQFRSNSWSDSLDDCRIVPALDLNRYYSSNSSHYSVFHSCFYHFFFQFSDLFWVNHNVNFTTATSACMQKCYFVGIYWCHVLRF